jgi:hypothetical protein
MAVSPFLSELVVLALNFDLRIMAVLTGFVRRIDGHADCRLLSGVRTIVLVVVAYLPLMLVEDDVIRSTRHDGSLLLLGRLGGSFIAPCLQEV